MINQPLCGPSLSAHHHPLSLLNPTLPLSASYWSECIYFPLICYPPHHVNTVTALSDLTERFTQGRLRCIQHILTSAPTCSNSKRVSACMPSDTLKALLLTVLHRGIWFDDTGVQIRRVLIVQVHCVCVCVVACAHIGSNTRQHFQSFKWQLFGPPIYFPLTISVGDTQVAMTPDCFVCPLTSLRGAVVSQALHVRGKQKRGEGGVHFLWKKWGPKGSSIHPLCTEQKVGSLWEACCETKTHVRIQTQQRLQG